MITNGQKHRQRVLMDQLATASMQNVGEHLQDFHDTGSIKSAVKCVISQNIVIYTLLRTIVSELRNYDDD